MIMLKLVWMDYWIFRIVRAVVIIMNKLRIILINHKLIVWVRDKIKVCTNKVNVIHYWNKEE